MIAFVAGVGIGLVLALFVGIICIGMAGMAAAGGMSR